jgi:hypothetical protein
MEFAALLFLRSYWKELALIALIAGAAWFGQHWLHARDVANYHDGYMARDAIVQQDINKAVKERADKIAANAAATHAADQAVNAKLTHEGQAFEQAYRVLSARLIAQENTPFVTNPEKPDEKPLLGQSVLDDGTVGLLNAARTGPVRLDAHGRATFGTDGEGTAPAYSGRPVTGREFAENDLEVVRLYRALAINHDALVDWVNQQCVAPKK